MCDSARARREAVELRTGRDRRGGSMRPGLQNVVKHVGGDRLPHLHAGGLVEPEMDAEIDPAHGILEGSLAEAVIRPADAWQDVRRQCEMRFIGAVEVGEDREESGAECCMSGDIAWERRCEVRL